MAGIREKLEVMFGVSGADKFKKEFEDADRSVQKSSKGMTGSIKAIGTAAVAYLSVQTVKAVSSAAFELVKLGDSFRVVQASSQRLAKSIGQNSSEILSAVRRGVGGAVSDLDLLKQVNQAILLGIPVTARQMENMAITATRLGRAVGRDAASALGDLVTGIGRMSPLILDNLGITIKLEEAYAGLGENATDAQKKIAFFNAVMKKANDASKTLGDQLPTIGEKMDKVYARVKNLGMAIGDALAGPVGKLLDIIDALPSHVAVVTAKINIAIANANPINQLSRLLTPGHQRRIMDAYAREGLFDVTPQFRFSNKAQYMDQGLRERSTPEELATVRMFEAFNNGQTFDMEPQIRDMTKDLDAGFKMVAKRAKEDLNDIPLSLESEFAKSFANISLGFSAVGLNGMTSFFGNVSNLGAGINGLTGGGKEPSWLTDRFLPALQMFGQAGQAFSGAVGIFQGIAGLFGGTKVSGDLSGLSTEELQNIVNGDLGQYSKFQDLGDEAVGQFQDLARKELTGRGVSTGSNAYSVTTSISETQANSILAVLETQRAQDAERNNLLGQSLAVQTDMKFLMSINSGNLLTFAG